MDLGGDDSRLYFYDPVNYLKTTVLYAVSPIGMNNESPFYFFLPFNILLINFLSIVKSPYLIITLFNSFKLVVSFLSMYAIARELLIIHTSKERTLFIELSSIFVGLFYIFHPFMQNSAWDKALSIHAQIFLNPLMFYFLLKFFLTQRMLFLLMALLISFTFSTNFSWNAAPRFFAFYPLAVLYIVSFTLLVKKKNIAFGKLLAALFLFFAIHAFHLLPLFLSLVEKTGQAYQRATESAGSFNAGLAYFLEVARHTRLSQNLLGFPLHMENFKHFEFLFFFIPTIPIVGLILNKQKMLKKAIALNFPLLFLFFLFTVYLTTAKITNLGFEFYKSLFNFPVFAMFRNYNGQFFFVYFFFLSLLIGQALFYILIALKSTKQRIGVYTYITVLILASAVPFIRGDMINLIWNKGEKVEFKIPIKMDPTYEKFLAYIRDNPVDGKYLSLPLTESSYDVLRGTQGGVYLGPSIISQIGGRSDFNGYQVMFPFSETFLELSKAKEYEAIETLLAMLNIKYIFYNSDDTYQYFPHLPYEHVRKYLLDHDSYNEFLGNLAITKKQSFGNLYHLYEVSNDVYLPHIYIPKRTAFFDRKKYIVNINNVDYTTNAFWKGIEKEEKRFVFLEERELSDMHIERVPKITVQKVNPTRYVISVAGARDHFMLVFSNAFHPRWKLFLANDKEAVSNFDHAIVKQYFNGDIKEAKAQDIWVKRDMFATWSKKPIADNRHYKANAYANAWYISPSDVGGKENYTLILEMTTQRVFYVGLLTSMVGLGIYVVWAVVLVSRIRKKD